MGNTCAVVLGCSFGMPGCVLRTLQLVMIMWRLLLTSLVQAEFVGVYLMVLEGILLSCWGRSLLFILILLDSKIIKIMRLSFIYVYPYLWLELLPLGFVLRILPASWSFPTCQGLDCTSNGVMQHQSLQDHSYPFPLQGWDVSDR